MNSEKLNKLIHNLKTVKYSCNDFFYKHHENNVEEIIIQNGFSKNVFDNVYYIPQPNGSQKPPDFIVYDYNESINIECKSNKTGYKPMWNCSIPDPSTYYIITNKKTDKTLVIKGDEIISNDVTRVLNKYKIETKNLELKYNEILNKIPLTDNPYKFNVYARNMFVQKIQFNPNDMKL